MQRSIHRRLISPGAVAAGVVLLIVLGPLGATAKSPPPRVYVPAYRGTLSSPTTQTGASACARAFQGPPKWFPALGTINESDSSSAKACAKTAGYVGAYSSAYSSASIYVVIPIKVPANGNHSIETNWTLTLSTVQSWTVGGCPKANLSFPVPSSSSESAYCTNQELVDIYLTAYLVDLSNASYTGGGYAYAADYNNSGWQNQSYCYNYGTPGCSNSTGPFNYSNNYGYNDPGWSAFRWNGVTKFGLWTNGTNMLRSDRWVVELNLYKDTQAQAGAYNVLGPWPGVAKALINMGTLGNSAKIDSITVY